MEKEILQTSYCNVDMCIYCIASQHYSRKATVLLFFGYHDFGLIQCFGMLLCPAPTQATTCEQLSFSVAGLSTPAADQVGARLGVHNHIFIYIPWNQKLHLDHILPSLGG